MKRYTAEEQQNCEHKNLSWKVLAGDGRYPPSTTLGSGIMLDNDIVSFASYALRGQIDVECNICGMSLRQPFGIPVGGVIGGMIVATAANLRDINGSIKFYDLVEE